MGWLKDQRGRQDRKASRAGLTADEAVERLRPTLRELLARLEGQSRSDLQVTLQLLPLGSRLALDAVGAVELEGQDPVEGRYRLKVLPFCVEVVNAAALKVEEARREGHGDSRTDEQLAATLHGERAGEAEPEVQATSAPEEAARAVDEPELVEQARQLAEDRILEGILPHLVREEPTTPQSSAEVAERTGLPEPAVAYTMGRLFKKGWLHVTPPAQSGESQFSLIDDRGLMIGMSLSRGHVDAVLTTLRTTQVIARSEHPLPDTSPQSVVQTVVGLAQELRGAAGPGQDIVGLGVALAGRVDATGTVFFAPDLQTDEHRWNSATLEDDLEAATRVTAFGRAENRVAVENDANALAMYEYLLQAADQDVSVVLMSESGEGIGGALVINGALVHGTEGVGGEIGHVVVDQHREPCRCGGRGCLETVASAAAIVNAIKKKTTVPVESLRDASALVERGDPAAARVFTTAGEALGRVLSVVTAAIGPPRVVIFGPPQVTQEFNVASARVFMDGVRGTHGNAILGVKVDVVPRVLGHDTLPTAAAATAVNYFISRPRLWMPTIAGVEVPDGQWGSRERVRAGEMQSASQI